MLTDASPFSMPKFPSEVFHHLEYERNDGHFLCA